MTRMREKQREGGDIQRDLWKDRGDAYMEGHVNGAAFPTAGWRRAIQNSCCTITSPCSSVNVIPPALIT